jgi:hypothetical protein
MNHSNSIYFLCKTPNEPLIEFSKEILNEDFCNVYIIVDDDSITFDDKIFIQVKDEVCINKNYINLNSSVPKTPSAWDKVIYHLCEKSNDDFCFIIEDDVFIPSIEVLKDIFKYSSFDLVTSKNKQKRDYIPNDAWVWKDVVGKINKPYFYSMVCAMGISRNLLNIAKNYVLTNKTFFYLEVFFNTLANQNSLNIFTPEEFSTILYEIDWYDSEILEKPKNLFHPLKDFNKHKELRKCFQKF